MLRLAFALHEGQDMIDVVGYDVSSLSEGVELSVSFLGGFWLDNQFSLLLVIFSTFPTSGQLNVRSGRFLSDLLLFRHLIYFSF